MPDCLIAARIANQMQRVLNETGHADLAANFDGFVWQSEEGALMDGYHATAHWGEHVTYDRLRAIGTNGFQELAMGSRAARERRLAWCKERALEYLDKDDCRNAVSSFFPTSGSMKRRPVSPRVDSPSSA